MIKPELKVSCVRVKFSGLEESHEGETSNARDRKLQPQRSRSFKGGNFYI